jgi:hypothetical protein
MQARCSQCDHDLICVGPKGRKVSGSVYCSNPRCRHRRIAHKTGPSLNHGLNAA